MIPQALLTILGAVVPDVLKRVLPEKVSDAERLRVETELQVAIMAQDWKAVEAEYHDRASARELAQADIARGNAFTGMLAAMVRPTWGFGAFALVAAAVLYGYQIPGVVETMLELVIIFFFGGRTIEKITPTVAAALDRGKKAA